jgi:mevalonate kinase
MKKALIYISGLIFFLILIYLLKTESNPNFITQTEREINDMKKQKDSIFVMAEEVTKKTEQLKLENDSLVALEPKVIIQQKVVEKIVLKENNDIEVRPLPIIRQNDVELDELRSEINILKSIISQLTYERDSLQNIIENNRENDR